MEKNKMKQLIIIFLLIAVLVAGCAKQETSEDISVEQISDEIEGLDILEDDLGLSELESLEQDLDNLI
jgi:ABC-type Fe3+-citrate transport system substrate-binding protein|tara:strand:+ start:131 stop:334 length:204 start_codon:yes stop_codon:yes gene_type:complete